MPMNIPLSYVMSFMERGAQSGFLYQDPCNHQILDTNSIVGRNANNNRGATEAEEANKRSLLESFVGPLDEHDEGLTVASEMTFRNCMAVSAGSKVPDSSRSGIAQTWCIIWVWCFEKYKVYLDRSVMYKAVYGCISSVV